MSEARKVKIVRFWMAFSLACVLAIWEPSFWFGLVPLFFSGQAGCFCCPGGGGCDILSDDFSVDNLATDWDDRSGTWSVAAGKLTTTSASALIVTVSEQAAGVTGTYVLSDITCASTADKGQLIAAYVDDSNYWFAEIQPGATNGTLKLFERAGGVDTQRGTTQTVTGYAAGDTAEVCVDVGFGFVTATAIHSGNTARIAFAASPTTENTAAGCGTGSGSSDVKFDDFLFGKHVVDDPACHTCGTTLCPALCSESPSTITIVLAGMANSACINCGNFNTTYVISEASDPAACQGISAPITEGCTGFAGTSGMRWRYIAVGADTVFEVFVSTQCGLSQDQYFWKHNLGPSPVNCYMTSQDIPVDSQTLQCAGGTGFCTNVSSTCTATTTP